MIDQGGLAAEAAVGAATVVVDQLACVQVTSAVAAAAVVVEPAAGLVAELVVVLHLLLPRSGPAVEEPVDRARAQERLTAVRAEGTVHQGSGVAWAGSRRPELHRPTVCPVELVQRHPCITRMVLPYLKKKENNMSYSCLEEKKL